MYANVVFNVKLNGPIPLLLREPYVISSISRNRDNKHPPRSDLFHLGPIQFTLVHSIHFGLFGPLWSSSV